MARRQAPGTRERILTVASRLFSRHGVRAVGMQQLVDETGLGKSLVYREFASKDDLVAAWLRDNDQAWVKLADAATAPHEGDPARQLLALVEFVYDSVRADEFYGCIFYNTLSEFREPSHPGRQAALEHLDRLRRLLRRYGREAGAADPNALADSLLLIIGGLLINGVAFGGTGPAEQAKPVAVAIIEQAVSGRAAGTGGRRRKVVAKATA
jgi:AcrR family transcriptional regulator